MYFNDFIIFINIIKGWKIQNISLRPIQQVRHNLLADLAISCI